MRVDVRLNGLLRGASPVAVLIPKFEPVHLILNEIKDQRQVKILTQGIVRQV